MLSSSEWHEKANAADRVLIEEQAQHLRQTSSSLKDSRARSEQLEHEMSLLRKRLEQVQAMDDHVASKARVDMTRTGVFTKVMTGSEKGQAPHGGSVSSASCSRPSGPAPTMPVGQANGQAPQGRPSMDDPPGIRQPAANPTASATSGHAQPAGGTLFGLCRTFRPLLRIGRIGGGPHG